MAQLLGAKWDTSTLGVGAIVTWSFAVPSVTVSGYSGYLQFEGGVADPYRSAVLAAFDAWEAVSNIDFRLVDDSADVDVRVGDRYIDGIPQPGQATTLATAGTWSNGQGEMRKAEIYFDVDAYTNSFFYYTALHEIGHALGLAHATDPNSVMYYRISAANTDEGLTADDIAGARQLYGVRGVATAPVASNSFSIAAGAPKLEGNTGSTAFDFTITRSGDVSAAASVAFTVAGAGPNAAAAADFADGALPSGTLAFGAGETSRTIQILVAGDGVAEADEGFAVTLGEPVGAGIAVGAAAAVIVDDDSSSSLFSISPVSLALAEGDSGQTVFRFNVTRSGPKTGAASVNYGLSGGAGDFAAGTPLTGLLSFAAGEFSKTILLPVTGDTVVEPDETFTVALFNPTGGALGVASAMGTILNDDAPSTFSLAPAFQSKPEGDEGPTAFSFTIARTGDLSRSGSVAYAVTSQGPTGASAGDFVGGELPKGVVSFEPGEASKAVVIEVAGDFAIESDESFAVALSDPVDGLLGTSTVAALILNDDELPPPPGGSGPDLLVGRRIADTITGGGGDDQIDGRGGLDTAVYAGASKDYAWWSRPDGYWVVKDLRAGSPEGTDRLSSIELLKFSDRTVKILGLTLDESVQLAWENILRTAAPSTPKAEAAAQTLAFESDSLVFAGSGLAAADASDQHAEAGDPELAKAIAAIVASADGTTSVATLAYQFFTGATPSKSGLDYLVSPAGGNPNNINSAYYQDFSFENRYINFAVNLGKFGEGKASFEAAFGSVPLEEALRVAYGRIFGAFPTATKISQLLDAKFEVAGHSTTRADYFAYYGQDGLNGVGTKAAMVGWLLAEAEKADLGMYARSNAAYLTDLADGADYGINLVGAYGQPEFVYTG
jgi:hypothetical protein